MSAMKHYFEDLATEAADAVWTEVMTDTEKNRTTYSDVWCMITDSVFNNMEDLFDDLWEELDGREADMPMTCAVCKELAKWIPDHLDTIWDLNPDLTPIV